MMMSGPQVLACSIVLPWEYDVVQAEISNANEQKSRKYIEKNEGSLALRRGDLSGNRKEIL